MVYYREVQSLRRWWITLLLIVPLVITGYGFYQQVFLGWPWGNRPVSDRGFFFIEAGLIAMDPPDSFDHGSERGRTRHSLRWAMAEPADPVRPRKSARDITYSPILDYGGWGVRWGWDGSMIYNANGDRGVELLLDNGKRLVVGSQRATELAQAIASRL